MKFKRKKIIKKRKSLLPLRKKFCRFCVDKVKAIDYKDTRRLETLVTDRGKIFSSRSSGTCARHQRMLREAILKARFLSIIPYIR